MVKHQIMKYSLKYPKVTFNLILNSEFYFSLKKQFYLQANSIDRSNDEVIWVNEYDTEYIETNQQFSKSDGPPIEVKKYFIKDFITPLIYKAEDLFKEQVFKILKEKETQGKSAVLVLNNRFKEYLEFFNSELIEANHLPSKIQKEINEALNRLEIFVDEELSINVFKDFSKNKIKLKMSVQEVCAFVLYLDSKELIGGGHSRKELIELIESHFMYYSNITKNYAEISSAKNTISNILGKGFRNPKREKLEQYLIDFNKTINSLQNK
jgi:hypothetical protein